MHLQQHHLHSERLDFAEQICIQHVSWPCAQKQVTKAKSTETEQSGMSQTFAKPHVRAQIAAM